MIRRFLSRNLSFKVAITVVAVLTVLGGSSFFYIMKKIQNQLIEANEREALTLASTLNSSVSAMMLKGGGLKPEEIQAVFLALEERKEIKSAVVFISASLEAKAHINPEMNSSGMDMKRSPIESE